MLIQTTLRAEHIELIKIFFKANELKDVVIGTCDKTIGGSIHLVITIEYDDESDSAQKISYMSLIHSGFQNMLDSYLICCGVSPFELNPSELKEKVTDRELEAHFKKIGLKR